MSHDRAIFETRRGRARGLRRRRRIQALFAVLTVAFAGAAVALALTGSRRNVPSGVARGAAGAPRPYAGPPPRLAANPRSRLTRELVALRRLASHGRPVYCGGRHGRMVALTFDDGPGQYTRLAVDKLRRARVAATFFLVGKQVLTHPRLAALERSLGSLVAWGDHTMTHSFLPALPPAERVQEIVAARILVARAERVPVLLFRPPYGGTTPAITAEIRRERMIEVLWNVDSADSLGANYLGIERNVTAGLRPGSIILLHENRGQTIRALPSIFAAIRRRHLEPVTLVRLLSTDPPTSHQLRGGEPGCGVVVHHGNGS